MTKINPETRPEVPELQTPQELEPTQQSYVERLAKQCFENSIELNPNEINISLIKAELEKAGLNLELTETQKQSLADTKFRNYETGRGIGVAAALGDRLAQFEEMAVKLCKDAKRTLTFDGIKYKHIGLRQVMADFMAVAVGAKTPEEFCQSVNGRATESRKPFNERDKKTTATLPLDSAAKMLRFLLA